MSYGPTVLRILRSGAGAESESERSRGLLAGVGATIPTPLRSNPGVGVVVIFRYRSWSGSGVESESRLRNRDTMFVRITSENMYKQRKQTCTWLPFTVNFIKIDILNEFFYNENLYY